MPSSGQDGPIVKHNAVRTTIGPHGRMFVSVTSAMGLVKTILGEPPDSYGPANLARFHAMEGTGCHAICLDWLAHKCGWLPDYAPPEWPNDHGAEERWHMVMNNALVGFQEFVEQYEFEALGIEQEAYSIPYMMVGHVDLWGTMRWKKRRVKAIVDLKFVTAILASHRLQVRCYSRLNGLRDAHIGILFHSNRNTGTWKVEPVLLGGGEDDVSAVANAARLYAWAESKRG